MTDTIDPGDAVSWKSTITDRRHFGTFVKTVLVDGKTYYLVRTRVGRVKLPLEPSRITKECN